MIVLAENPYLINEPDWAEQASLVLIVNLTQRDFASMLSWELPFCRHPLIILCRDASGAAGVVSGVRGFCTCCNPSPSSPTITCVIMGLDPLEEALFLTADFQN